MLDDIFGTVVCFVFGLIFGSFFNVLIYRLPEDKPIGMERSRCRSCDKIIPWYFNIPLFSYAFLRGRCAFCKARISAQYPLVELATGVLFALLYCRYNLSPELFAYFALFSAFLVISVIDLHHQIIPNEISLPGIVIGFLVSSFLPTGVGWQSSLLGILAGGGIFWAIAAGYEKLTGREGLGGGDIKLLGMIGAWLGVQSVLPVIILSSASGSIIGIALMMIQGRNMKTAIPFGPFLVVGAVVFYLTGDSFISWMIPPATPNLPSH